MLRLKKIQIVYVFYGLREPFKKNVNKIDI